VLYQSNSVPYLVGASFQFTNAYSPYQFVGTVQVQGENFNTGVFWGVYTDAIYGVQIWVSGQISGTTTSGGITTSHISFNGSTSSGWYEGFYGTMTGTGSVNPSGCRIPGTGDFPSSIIILTSQDSI
jgi:hypothetical protein